ncbi:hypothetical protein CEXT_783601 [Caerostris extrusa]|uniref:Secreted protein n=1 Tax=Caerostris extrusa TaxID=172846 RepID=A0AAV4NZ67_CAEEX|nr:hypothetical protein CEXT_783601 [Caerostris extrusa]
MTFPQKTQFISLVATKLAALMKGFLFLICSPWGALHARTEKCQTLTWRVLLSVPLQLLFRKNSKRFERRGPLALNNTLLCHTLINSADKHDSTMGNNQAALEF